MTDVGLLAALLAGVLALLSPCSALLLPSFFAYAFASPSALLLRTGVFYVGLALTLVPLGVGAAVASQLFYGHRAVLISVAGWSIIGLGALLVLGRGFALPFAGRLQTWATGLGGGWLGTLALGAVYGLAGFCSGPVLGAILTVAATRPSPLDGGLLLAVYALGMAAPLFLLAALWERYDLARRGWLRGRIVEVGRLRVHTTSALAGLLFIAVGFLFLRYDGTAGLTGALGIGDTTELEFALQGRILSWTAPLPPWLVPAVVAVVAGTMAARRFRAGRRERATDAR